MLELKNICKQYQQTTIIDHLSITFPDTGMIGIQGKSGCGKSTLLYIMGMLDDDYQGEIFYNGEKITDIQATVSKEELEGDGAVVQRGKKKFKKVVVK